MNRNDLISLSLKYNGEYSEIIKAIKRKEIIEPTNYKNAITIFDDNYPSCLYNLKLPPLVLFYEGNIDLLKEDKIAVIGSRMPCDYALKATNDLCRHYNNKVIVSGLAKGIDTMAHLSSNKTIGILGCGIDYYYPNVNKKLIDEMKVNQLVLSEYPGMSKPLGFHFPFRNRIIACLVDTVYVMQSLENSGTYTTVNEALELGKNIKVLPYDIYSSCSKGNLKLIKDGADLIEIEELL